MTGDHYSFVCSNGCGVCGVKVVPFERERTETVDGEYLGSVYEPRVVSTCCGSPVNVYDNRAERWGAEVDFAPASVGSSSTGGGE